jgi:hypothetical protein
MAQWHLWSPSGWWAHWHSTSSRTASTDSIPGCMSPVWRAGAAWRHGWGGGMPCHHWHSTCGPWRLPAGWARGRRCLAPQGVRPRARARCIKLELAKPVSRAPWPHICRAPLAPGDPRLPWGSARGDRASKGSRARARTQAATSGDLGSGRPERGHPRPGAAAQLHGSGRRPGIACPSGSSRPARGSIVARHLLAGGCRCSRPRQPGATPWRLRAASRRWRCVEHGPLRPWPGPRTQRAPEEAGGGLRVIGQCKSG